jgi:hypothetical protein
VTDGSISVENRHRYRCDAANMVSDVDCKALVARLFYIASSFRERRRRLPFKSAKIRFQFIFGPGTECGEAFAGRADEGRKTTSNLDMKRYPVWGTRGIGDYKMCVIAKFDRRGSNIPLSG